MAEYHWQQNADITVAVQPVHRDQAFRFGLLKRDSTGRILDFVEKPKTSEVRSRFISRSDPERPFLGSMGIYIFNTDVLVDILTSTTNDDFGGEVIPHAIHTHKVVGFDFDDYWEDIGTIRSFYEVNLSLTRPDSPFNLQDPLHPLYTRPRFLSGANINGASLANTLVADGCRIGKAEIHDCVIGLRSMVRDGVFMCDTILMGTDYYDPTYELVDRVSLGVGQNCHIEGAIIDKNACLGPDVRILPFPPGTEIDGDDWVVRDGIVVIPKNTTLSSGTVIGPEEAHS